MFSKTAEYALRATFYIAKESSARHKVSIKQIAEAIGSPIPFTAKILQQLSKNDAIISSVRGPNGGFFFKDAARKVAVMSILEIINEDHTLKGCVLGLPHCGNDRPCPMHFKYKGIKEQLIRLFNETTIEDVASDLDSEMFFINPFLQTKAGKKEKKDS